jgi:PIN domain nuclease of toxin-antitoxin system
VEGSTFVKLLLDTHIWIWSLTSPEKLSRAVRRELDNPKNEIYLSPVAIWEAHHMERRKKLRLKQDFTGWLDQVFLRTPVREAPFNFAVAAAASRIQLAQADLGDVFLAATALVFDLTLVTADAQLIECSWLKTLSND